VNAIVNQPEVAPPHVPAVIVDDPDQKAYEDAVAALAAEEALTPPATPPAAEPATPAAATPAATAPQAPAGQAQPTAPATPPAAAAPGTVPVAAVAALRRKVRETEDALIYRQGENETLRALIAAGAVNPPAVTQRAPQATPQEQVAAERAKVTAAAKEFDAGKISAEQLESARAAADDQIWAIRNAQTVASVKAAQPQPAPAPAPVPVTPGVSVADEQVLEAKLQEIQAVNPWTAETSPITPEQWDYLGDLARHELRAEGIDADRLGSKGTLLLRERGAELATMYGPRWHKGWTPPAAAAPVAPQAGVPVPGQQPSAPMSPAAQARLDALNLAAAMPPDINGIGQQAPAGAVFSDAEIEAMPSGQLERLMEAKDPRLAAFLNPS
jgi:hypothetical protein